jgi:hypothetical protein
MMRAKKEKPYIVQAILPINEKGEKQIFTEERWSKESAWHTFKEFCRRFPSALVETTAPNKLITHRRNSSLENGS